MAKKTKKHAAKTPSLTQKAYLFAMNSLEKHFFSEDFIVSNQTPYEVVYRDRIMSVRHYAPLVDDSLQVGERIIAVTKRRHRIPVVLVPPLAATSIIFDLLPQRSVVRFFLAHGFDVFMIDWGEVTEKDSDISLETYVLDWMPDALQRVREVSGEAQVSLFCYCMGGLLALMYAAVSQDAQIRNIVTVASPVDMHQSGVAGRLLTLIYRPARIVSNLLHFSLLDLPARYMHIPGWLNSLAFKLTSPIGTFINKFELLINMWDREYVKEHVTMSKWFDEMVDYPGETIKEMAVHMMINNRMAKGKMRIGAEHAEFKQIRCAILAFAGDSDTLVSQRAARKVLEIVSSDDKEFCVVPGGHAGVFGGSLAPDYAWAMSADWLAERSD